MLLVILSALCGGAPVEIAADRASLIVRCDAGSSLAVSLAAPRFTLDGEEVGGGPGTFSGTFEEEKPNTVEYTPISLKSGGQLEVRVFVEWLPAESVLQKWARIRLVGGSGPRLLTEVVLERLPVADRHPRAFPGDLQSYPVLMDKFFAGIEFPMAATRLEGDAVVLAHRPGLKVFPDTEYETRKAVYGVAYSGQELAAFQHYIMLNRPESEPAHCNYNSWWTSPAPYYTEKDILDLMSIFEEKLYKPHKTSFDTFCIDMGWSNPKSLWEIDPKLFPEGFTHLQEAATRMGCHLGLWISPSCCYPTALDAGWAKENGYETLGANLCLAGKKYSAAFRDRLVEMVTRYGVRHIKLDGYIPQCPEKDHGHEPGPLSAEPIAEGIIAAAEAVHKAAPDTWLEPTCFGLNPSPWWLFHFNSVIGSFGDDAPSGRVPAPVYRESYTTARDFFNLQGAYWNPAPQAAQEVLGIIHQTPEPFMNDAVMTLLRGHGFLPVYLNPKFMDDGRWRSLAEILNWVKDNALIGSAQCRPLLPASWLDGKCPKFTAEPPMPREPYGYLLYKPCEHGIADNGTVVLRNPWIAPQHYALKLDWLTESEEVRDLWVVSFYPEPRVYARNLKIGATVDIALAPYETLALSIHPRWHQGDHSELPGVPEASQALRKRIDVTGLDAHVRHIEYDGPPGALGPDWTSLVGDAAFSTRLGFSAQVAVDAPQAELLVLFDGAQQAGSATLRVNDQSVTPTVSSSDLGWSASGMTRPEHWTFLRASLPEAVSRIALEVDGPGDGIKTSVWVWATKPGHPNAAGIWPPPLPQPELVSLDAAPLFEPADLSTVPAERTRAERPVERIQGVFLDALEPVSVTQGWGTLQKNKSVWEKPMTISGKTYRRGLGTHAPSKIAYALDGQYRRFQAWAGADGATSPTITFEVWVDGAKRWESGLMKREDPAKQVDVDVTQAKTLELVVGDGGNDLMADHADWAEAKLLK